MTRFMLILVFATAALLMVACGVGEPTAEGKIAETADNYLRALADGDTGGACTQLTAEARAALAGSCRGAMETLATRVGRDALIAATDGGVDVDVDGDRGSAQIRELAGVRLALVRAGDRWRIASGQSLEP